MKQKVWITVTGTQTSPENGENTVEISVPGEYSCIGNHYFLIYEEIDEDTAQTTRNLVKCRNGSMEVTKSGMIYSHILLENGKQFVTTYRTPFGEIPVDFQTSSVSVSADQTHFLAEASYVLGMDGSYAADCKLRISARFLSG